MSPIQYIHETERKFKVHLAANFSGRFRLPKRADKSFKISYNPELDIHSELEPDAASYFQIIISILRCMIKLGRNKRIPKVSVLSSHLVTPRKGHLDAADHIMAYVGQKYNSRLVYCK